MSKKEIEAFLSHLAVQQKVAASTQRQALNAIVFLYKKVLDIPVDEKLEPVRAKKYSRPPVVRRSWGHPLDYWFTCSLRFKPCFSAIFFPLETAWLTVG